MEDLKGDLLNTLKRLQSLQKVAEIRVRMNDVVIETFLKSLVMTLGKISATNEQVHKALIYSAIKAQESCIDNFHEQFENSKEEFESLELPEAVLAKLGANRLESCKNIAYDCLEQLVVEASEETANMAMEAAVVVKPEKAIQHFMKIKIEDF